MSTVAAPEPCVLCKGFGVVETPEGRVVACRCRLGDLAEARLRAAQIPERYRNCTLENYIVHKDAPPSQRVAKMKSVKFVEEWKSVRYGLLFIGTVGVGKTHLATAILRRLIEECGAKGVFCDFSDLLERIKATFSKTNPDSADDVLAPYREAEILVLDELGAQRPTDWVRDVLYGLINTRYNRQRITIVTSNYGDAPRTAGEETLESRVGVLVRSRLHEMCVPVLIEGDDYRKKQRAWSA
ncbi:MAG TPA: ATP-binding protein [Thermoanaerobaculia bacterium]|nr:ATP-binding protein [Thermoanaerobaculia bacterium]